MGSTSTGLPWPAGTDPVRDGDNAIKALADQLTVQMPVRLVKFWAQALTTNASGDISLSTPGLQPNGAVAITWNSNPQTAGAYMARVSGAPANTLWFRCFNAAGAPIANASVAFNVLAWGAP